TSEGQWAEQAFGMSIEKGVVLAFQLSREAMRKAPKAQALLLPGGTWRSLAAVPTLEEDFNIPVVTNTTARVWQLISKGVAPPVEAGCRERMGAVSGRTIRRIGLSASWKTPGNV